MLVAKISTWLILLFLIGIAASFILPTINFLKRFYGRFF